MISWRFPRQKVDVRASCRAGSAETRGDYGFILTAIDGNLPGGGGQDKFRIRIWNRSGGCDRTTSCGLIYDNFSAAAVYSDSSATALGGGSIVIHSNPLEVSGGRTLSENGSATLTPEALELVIAEAIARWRAFGVDPGTRNAPDRVEVQITDLPGSQLGLAAPGAVWIDRDAAGYGWFIDPTPAEDSEFQGTAKSPAHGKVDLLSVLAHEWGHLLGFEHAHDDSVMGAFLAPGTRHVPTSLAGAEALAPVASGVNGPTLPGQVPLAQDAVLALPAVAKTTQVAAPEAEPPQGPFPMLFKPAGALANGEGLHPALPDQPRRQDTTAELLRILLADPNDDPPCDSLVQSLLLP